MVLDSTFFFEMIRSCPNILITGTPGVGKSTLCAEIIKNVNLEWLEISKIAKTRDCLSGFDEKLNCPVIDEDKLVDELDPVIQEGGKIVEYHGCDFFPKRWFDAVFVLRTNNTILYDRLQKRGYNNLKITKNVECEIFQVILEEAMESYDESIVKELHNNITDDMEKNIKVIVYWIEQWMENARRGKIQDLPKMIRNENH